MLTGIFDSLKSLIYDAIRPSYSTVLEIPPFLIILYDVFLFEAEKIESLSLISIFFLNMMMKMTSTENYQIYFYYNFF